MTEFIHQFHFLRPGWLLALLPILLMTGWMVRRTLTQSRWSDHIDPHLQGYMLDSQPGQASQLLNGLVTASLMIAVIALAGPTWERKPVPVIANPNALVLLMDMSLSMKAQDMAPDRAVRAIRKATDIVRGREDGVTAVIAYAGDAHTVVPFTDDQATIEHLISSLSPEIMPKPGSRPDRAVSKAATLMQDAGINQADFLLITDGIRQQDIARITTALPANTCVHSIAVGTPEGAPIPLGDQGFIKDASGTIVLPKLDTQPLQALADDTGCRWQPIRYDDRDWQTLLNTSPDLTADRNSGPENDRENDQENQEKRTLEIWADAGIWLTWLLVPVSLLMFRRGTLFILCLGIGISVPAPASPWQTGDQEGAQWFAQDPAKAATLFDDPQWQGSAHYRNGNYEAAAQAFAQDDTPAAHYNRGNALAMQGELEQAIAAYETALSQQPDFPEAQENLDALKAMQEQQSQQDSSDGSDSKENSDSSESSENSDKPESSDQSEGSEQSDGSEDNSEQSDNSRESGESQPNDSNSSSDGGSDSGSDSSSNSNEQNSSGQDSGSPDSASQSNSDASQSDDDQRRSDDEYAEQMAQKQSSDAQQSESQRAAQDSSKESSDEGSDKNSPSITAQQESTESSESESGQQALPPQTPQKDAGNDWPANMSREQQAVMEGLMNEVDDNPGLLMQRKFLYQYRQSADQTEEDVLW